MRRAAVLLLVLYAVLGVVALAMLDPGVVSTLVIFSFGLGLPIALAPLLFLYATALLPALFAYGFRLHAAWVIIIATVPVAVLALGPPSLARFAADAQFATLTNGDFAKSGPRRPQTIEFVRRVPFYGGQNTPLGDAICDATCQKLLLNGEVERVVVAAVSTSDWVNRRVGYVRERRSACPEAFARAVDALPETVAAAAHGVCIVPIVDDPTSVAVTVSDIARYPHENGFAGPAPTDVFAVRLTVPRAIRRLEIVDRTQDRPVVLVHQTETTMHVLARPLTVLPGSAGQDLLIAEQWQRDTIVNNPINADTVLRRTVGFDIAAIRGFEKQDDRTLLRLLLDRPGDEPVDAVGQSVMREAMRVVGDRSPPSSDDVALVRDTLTDPRFTDILPVAQLLLFHQEIARQLMPDILTRLQSPQEGPSRSDRVQLAGAAMKLTSDELRPHAAELVALVAADAPGAEAILPRLGELAADPVPLLGQALASKRPGVAPRAITGICRLDPAVVARLIVPLIAYLDSVEIRHTAPYEFATGIVALRRFGREDAVTRLIGRLTPRQVDALDGNLKRRPPGYSVDSCGR